MISSRSFFITFLAIFSSFGLGLTAQATEIPSRPLAGVRDDAQILPLPILKATEKVLADHLALTSETIFLLTVADAESSDLDSTAQAIMQEWKLDSIKPPNTVLIMVDRKSGEISIRSGFGLSSVLTNEETDHIRSAVFHPEWHSKNPERAVVLSVLETLNGLESPVFTSHEVREVYESAGFQGGFEPVAIRSSVERSWWIWSILGFFIVGFVLIRALAGEAHYTALGWVRVPAWRGILASLKRAPNKKRGPGLITGGGVSGNW